MCYLYISFDSQSASSHRLACILRNTNQSPSQPITSTEYKKYLYLALMMSKVTSHFDLEVNYFFLTCWWNAGWSPLLVRCNSKHSQSCASSILGHFMWLLQFNYFIFSFNRVLCLFWSHSLGKLVGVVCVGCKKRCKHFSSWNISQPVSQTPPWSGWIII